MLPPRRRPEQSTLYRVVQQNLNTLYAAVEAGFAGAALPPFVRAELEGFLGCGLACRGFASLKCRSCSERHLVAFSCHGRGFCPSCLGRRMAQTTLNLLENVIPEGVPLRQWVLTVPFELRARLAYDGKLLGAVGRIFVDSVLGWYRRRMALEGAPGGRSGALSVVQRGSSDCRLNPHFHVAFLDGVYVASADGKLSFRELGRLSTSEVADVLQVVRVRLLGYLARRGVIEAGPEATLLDDGFSEREPALAQLAQASVCGLPPAGPDRRCSRPEIALRGRPGVRVSSPLCVRELGFSLHAATRAGAEDGSGRETLLKYMLRPPVANDRLRPLPDGLVRIELKKPFSDGTSAIDIDPLALLGRLAALVPPPRLHTVRYSGVLGSASAWRSLIIPPPEPSTDEPPLHLGPAGPQDARPPTGARSRYRPWAELLKKTFAIDLRCPRCGAEMRLLALITDPASISRYLRHLGEPTSPPPLAPARAPPYFISQALRRHRPEAAETADLFGA